MSLRNSCRHPARGCHSPRECLCIAERIRNRYRRVVLQFSLWVFSIYQHHSLCEELTSSTLPTTTSISRTGRPNQLFFVFATTAFLLMNFRVLMAWGEKHYSRAGKFKSAQPSYNIFHHSLPLQLSTTNPGRNAEALWNERRPSVMLNLRGEEAAMACWCWWCCAIANMGWVLSPNDELRCFSHTPRLIFFAL